MDAGETVARMAFYSTHAPGPAGTAVKNNTAEVVVYVPSVCKTRTTG